MKNRLLISLFSIAMILSGTAQTNVEFTKENFPGQSKQLKIALKNIKAGDKLFSKKGNTGLVYREALDYYRKAQSFNENNVALNLRLAECYFRLYDPASCAKYGTKAYELDSVNCTKTFYFKGYALQQAHQFNEAIRLYRAYESAFADAKDKWDAKTRIKECEVGKSLEEKEVNCFIDNLGININGLFDDYRAVTTKNDSLLYFTTRRVRDKIDYAIDGKQRESIYMANRKGDNEYSQAEISEKWLRNIESLQAISKDGKYMIVYSSKGGGDFYEMKMNKKNNAKWSKPKPMKTVNSPAHETSASLSFTGDTLYFCSDRKSTFGEHDIYVSIKNKNGKWQKPRNMGDVINTPYDEISVSVDQQGKYLYFSSKGHQGMGGFDIFKVNIENGVSQPENVGFPLNSAADDVYFTLSEDGKTGNLSSNRISGMGGYDIYNITLLGERKMFITSTESKFLANVSVLSRYDVKTVDVEEEKKTIVLGVVLDAKTKEPLFASIELSDIEQNQLLATFTSDSLTGKYTLSLPLGVNYGASVKKEGYLYHSENFNIPLNEEAQTINQVIFLNKIEVNQVIVLKNIFFDVNKTTLKPESATEIDNAYKLLVENPTIEIELSGHTDNTGSAATNRRLSEGRAQAVVNALKEKGIDASRMKAVGYGPDKPIASNKTEAGRAENRRTEFKVIKK